MSSSNGSSDKVTTIAITLVVLGLLLLYFKKSGSLAEVQQALSFLKSN